MASLERIFSSYHKSLETTGAYPPLLGAQGQNGHASQPAKESPQTLVWVLYYLAQHYDRLGQAAQAHELLGVALGHTPTLIELHTLQSKLRRHAGDLEGRAQRQRCHILCRAIVNLPFGLVEFACEDFFVRDSVA